MNIGSLFRGMMGDNKPGEAKQMELKEGQVVRGVVTSVSEDGQEAVVQIQGVKVRAKLETPLQQGETTLLQVQPPGKDGMTVLKPVTASQTPIPPSTMNDLLNSFQLPDTKDNREMLTQMRAAGIALTAENVKTIQSSMAQKPASVSVGEWVQSAAVALQRGLPVTGQSVAGLQQAIFGPPLHESLDNLQNLIRSILPQLESSVNTPGSSTPAMANEGKAPATMPQGQPAVATGTAALTDGADPKSNPTPAANANSQQTATANSANATNTATAAGNTTAAIVGKLQQVLQQLNNLIPQAGGTPVSGPGTSGQQVAGMTTSTPGLASDEQAPTNSNAATGSAAASSAPTAATSPGSASPWLGQLLKLMGAEYEQQSVRAALTLTAQNSDPAKGQGTAPGANAQAQQSTTAQAGNERAAATSAQSTAPTPPTVPTAPIVPNVAQPLPANAASLPNTPVAPAPNAPAPALANGATSTQAQVASNDSATTSNPATTNTAATTLLSPQAGNERTGALPNPAHLVAPHSAAAEEALNKAQDTLKGLLLQLSAADDVPPVLKDAAQQLVQQLTGQQLLLNTDRTAPFAQVTMFVPFNGPEGQETASVHIQSRRGSKGELDASNCRLWFDLDMKALGHTLLDVQVVDRIVSLKVHNDLELLGPVIENKRQEVAEAISGLGYQLLSLNFAPLPVRSTTDPLIGNAGNVGELIDQFAPSEYKGVDMKI